jgi:hypothetical protein
MGGGGLTMRHHIAAIDKATTAWRGPDERRRPMVPYARFCVI